MVRAAVEAASWDGAPDRPLAGYSHCFRQKSNCKSMLRGFSGRIGKAGEWPTEPFFG
jgi:hypothetical protein